MRILLHFIGINSLQEFMTCPEINSWKPCPSSERGRKICRCAFRSVLYETSLQKSHSVAALSRQRNVPESVINGHTTNVSLYHLTKLFLCLSFTIHFGPTEIGRFLPILSIRIVKFWAVFICSCSILRISQLESAVCLKLDSKYLSPVALSLRY